MLTEQEVSRAWTKLFRAGQINADSFVRAEQLIDELRPESPLRHRLCDELEELRNLQQSA